MAITFSCCEVEVSPAGNICIFLLPAVAACIISDIPRNGSQVGSWKLKELFSWSFKSTHTFTDRCLNFWHSVASAWFASRKPWFRKHVCIAFFASNLIHVASEENIMSTTMRTKGIIWFFAQIVTDAMTTHRPWLKIRAIYKGATCFAILELYLYWPFPII